MRFSQAVIHNGVVYLSGQVAFNTDGSVRAQTQAILSKIDSLLEKSGTDKSRLLTANIWMTDISKVDQMNAVWDEWIDKDNMPVRACVQSALVDDRITVEIQATAALPRKVHVVDTPAAAEAVGPYNQAIVVKDDTVYVSGCIGLVPGSGQMAGSDVVSQGKQALANMNAILEAAGASANDIVKTTVLLDDISDFVTFNELYKQFFENADKVPARSTFAAKQLPRGALVEIECIAVLP